MRRHWTRGSTAPSRNQDSLLTTNELSGEPYENVQVTLEPEGASTRSEYACARLSTGPASAADPPKRSIGGHPLPAMARLLNGSSRMAGPSLRLAWSERGDLELGAVSRRRVRRRGFYPHCRSGRPWPCPLGRHKLGRR